LTVVMRFYRWLGNWITRTRGRAAALELVRPSLELIGNNALAIRTAATWYLEAELPELLPELAAAYADEFAAEPQLGYLLAEGYLRLGDEAAATVAAENASESVVRQLDSLKNLRSLNLDEIQANRHHDLAQELARRGLFPWAEKEYLRSLDLNLKQNTERIIREDLAEFYWFGGEHAKAAEVLRPLAENILARNDSDLPNAPGDFSNPSLTVANYYFYLGLAAIDRQDLLAASDYLRKALEVDSGVPNPDVVIAMKRIATEEPFRTYYQEQFDKMCDEFRVRVVEAEEFMSRATDRMQRANAAPVLANACNQLAWLLSKCEASPSEAISLSHRSLELWPDEPAYLDTLARCYFAAGQIEEAIRVQTRAVKLAPFERQMALQLGEFKDALKRQQTPLPDNQQP
jgi:tetratricopeptide (TPR) repeat protein